MNTRDSRAWAAGLVLSLVAGAALAQNCMLRDANLRGRYEGACVRGWANGQGHAEGKDRYEGSFMDGHAHGQGVYTLADGGQFDGVFAFGKVTGLARFRYTNGDVLEGEFRNNRLQGVGRLQRREGDPLLVELRGAKLVPAPVQLPPPATAGTGAGGTAIAPGQTAAPAMAAGPAQGWEPQLDFDDVFPSFILTTATYKPPSQGGNTRALATRLDATAESQGAVVMQRAAAGAVEQTRAALTQRGQIYIGDPWGQVGFRLRNDKPGSQVTLLVTVDEIAEPTLVTYTLDQAGDYALYPPLRYRYDRLRNFTQPTPINVGWSVWMDGQPRGSAHRTARLRSVNDVPFMLRSARGLENMSWVFSGFVTEDAPWVPELLREAFAGLDSGALGYQGGPNVVDAQVRAIWDMLKRRGVKYSSITDTAGSDQRVVSQFVRFPSESLRSAEANCADGTVLMATLLKRAGIQPLIVTGPGHALMGYVIDDKKKVDLDNVRFVETTMIANAPFNQAVQSGNQTVAKWLDKSQNHPMFRIVLVDNYRAQGVMPIPR